MPSFNLATSISAMRYPFFISISKAAIEFSALSVPRAVPLCADIMAVSCGRQSNCFCSDGRGADNLGGSTPQPERIIVTVRRIIGVMSLVKFIACFNNALLQYKGCIKPRLCSLMTLIRFFL